MPQVLRCGLVILSALGAVFMATAQALAALDPQRVTIGGEVRERYEFRVNADFDDQAGDTLSFVGSRIRLSVGYEATPDLLFFLQMQDSRLFGGETTTVSNEKNLDLHQGYLAVKNLPGSLTLTLGRQEMGFGDFRVVGISGWSTVGRSFDGLRLAYPAGAWRLDLWGSVTKQYGTNVGADPDPTKENQDSQQFYGVYATVKAASFSVEPYVLYLRDTGNPNEVDASGALISPIAAPAARGQERVTAGLRVDRRAVEDGIDVTGEVAYQGGSMAARGTTPKSDIRAYALAVKAGYRIPVRMKPRIGIEYDRASGDDDPADARFRTFETLFPANHRHYGYMDYVGWRNMQDLRVSLSARPTEVSSVSIDYHRVQLAEKSDHWYAASGKVFMTTPAGNSETDLGQELDVVASTVVKERLRLEAGYSRFFPGDYVKANSTAHDPSDFFYLQATMDF